MLSAINWATRLSIAISTSGWLISWRVAVLGRKGEVRQKLDLFANEKLKAALKTRDIVAGIASEEGKCRL
ncbi:hypothetical protein ACNKHU_26560 [Shigella flexneri]